MDLLIFHRCGLWRPGFVLAGCDRGGRPLDGQLGHPPNTAPGFTRLRLNSFPGNLMFIFVFLSILRSTILRSSFSRVLFRESAHIGHAALFTLHWRQNSLRGLKDALRCRLFGHTNWRDVVVNLLLQLLKSRFLHFVHTLCCWIVN